MYMYKIRPLYVVSTQPRSPKIEIYRLLYALSDALEIEAGIYSAPLCYVCVLYPIYYGMCPQVVHIILGFVSATFVTTICGACCTVVDIRLEPRSHRG